MRRRQLPECTRLLLEEVNTILPSYDFTTIEDMVRSREVRFRKGELKTVIQHIHEKFEFLGPSNKNIIVPSDVEYLRKYFLILVDKVEADPIRFVTETAEPVPKKVPKKFGRPPGKAKAAAITEAVEKKAIIPRRRQQRAAEVKAVQVGKRKIVDNSTDSEQETDSSEQSAPPVKAVKKRRRRFSRRFDDAKTAESSEKAETSSFDTSESPEAEPSFDSPAMFQLFPVSPSSGDRISGGALASSSYQMPPALTIPPPAFQKDQMDQIPHVVRFHSLVDRNSGGSSDSLVDSGSGMMFQCFPDQNSDFFEDFNDEALELLKTLLDSPRASPDLNNGRGSGTRDPESDKIRICFRAKKSLEAWDW